MCVSSRNLITIVLVCDLHCFFLLTILKKGERYGFVDGGERAAVEMWGAGAEIGEEARAGAKSHFCESK